MLVRANRYTKQLCFKLSRNDLPDCCNVLSLWIDELVGDDPPIHEYRYSKCGGLEVVEKKREPSLTLMYDMFNLDDCGRVCFVLDSQFATLKDGRYKARICACGEEIYNFQIDKREKVKVSQLSVDDRNTCCEVSCGC